MTAIAQFVPGFRTVDGSQLNLVVTAVNNMTGNGTPQAISASSASASSLSVSGSTNFAPVTVAAAGATQGNATAIPAAASHVVITVTASTEGVKLPAAVAGSELTIFADPAVGAKVYAAAAGQKIGAATTATTAYALVKNTSTTFYAVSATNWRVVKGG